MIYEAGVIGAEPERLPLSIGDPTLVSGALSVVSKLQFHLDRNTVGDISLEDLLDELSPDEDF